MKKNGMILLGLLMVARLVDAQSIGLIVALEGKASATDSTGVVRELVVKSEIMLNDTVKTDLKSRLQIMLSDDTLLAVGENSELMIDEYVFNPAVNADNALGVKMGKGLFRTVTGKITDLNPDRFKVKTSRATIGIRGCDVAVDTSGDNEDKVAVITIPEGKEIIIKAIESGEVITVETPTFVTIDSRGIIFQRDLTPADRKGAQQGTTPHAGSPSDGIAEFPDLGPLIQPDFKPAGDNTVIQGTEQHGIH